jgi:hypothetical protein
MIKTFQIDGRTAQVDEEDYDRVIRHTWHLRHGKPRARIFLKRVAPPGVDVEKLPAVPHQIPLERFVYGFTPYTNTRILHLLGDQLNCARSTMFVDSKDPTIATKFKGVIIRDTGVFTITDEGKELGPFPTEFEAAKAYDSWALSEYYWRARTNFYPQLLEK